MIDTWDYEGHTPAPWLATHDLVETEAKYGGTFTHVINHNGWRVWVGKKDTDVPHLQNYAGSRNLDEADAKLIADAPLLLAEVKRLRGILGDIVEIEEWGGDGKDIDIAIKYGDGYVFRGWLDKVHGGDDE